MGAFEVHLLLVSANINSKAFLIPAWSMRTGALVVQLLLGEPPSPHLTVQSGRKT